MLVSLLLDTSRKVPVFGVFSKNLPLQLCSGVGNTLEVFIAALRQYLENKNLTWKEISEIVFCEGPGSTLGIRVVNLFLSTLQVATKSFPLIRSFNSMILHGKMLWDEGNRIQKWVLVSDYKNQKFLALDSHSTLSEESIRVITDSTLASLDEKIYFIPQRRDTLPMVRNYQKIPYQPEKFSEVLLENPEVLKTVSLPRSFEPEKNTYQIWNGQRHQ